MESIVIIRANLLRNLYTLNQIPGDNPGWYRWWCPKESTAVLLGDYFESLLPTLTEGAEELSGYYYLYVGIAVKESIRQRLNWHVNQKHSLSAVRWGFLSTLRQTLSSLACKDQSAESETNEIVDKFFIEYFPVVLPVKSKEAKEIIEQRENKEMSAHVLPLNIQNNKRIEVQDFKGYLRRMRKISKAPFVKLSETF